MGTNVVVAFFVLGFVALAVLLVAVIRRWRSEEVARAAETEKTAAEKERRSKSAMKEKVDAGTHMENGAPRCALRPCPLEATMPELHMQREDLSFHVWLQRRYGGARQRVRIVPGKKLKYCIAHSHAVHSRYQHRAVASEARIADFISHEDAGLAEYEISVDEDLSADLALKREAAAAAPSIPPHAPSIPPPSSTASRSPLPSAAGAASPTKRP